MCFPAVLDIAALMDLSIFKFHTHLTLPNTKQYVFVVAIIVNGCEIAFISLLASENDFRIPECLPCLHNKVLAEDADAAVGFSPNQKKKQDTTSGILGGIIKGFSGGKVEHNVDLTEAQKTDLSHLDSIFSRVLFSDPSTFTADSQGVVELSIDDIEIDGPLVVESSSRKSAGDKRDKETEREKLFEGSNTDVKPKTRTPAEIIAKYRSAGDASTAAAHARDRLVERQEKLEREIQFPLDNHCFNALDIIGGSANVQKSCGVGLRTLHQWRASSPRRWKIENGGTNNKIPICSPYAAAPIQKQAHHLFTLCPLLGTYSSGFQVPHHT
ncbi:hypothetical protein CK203_085034 [Vitis vinifera]|uniref:Uncharacterized protein n=1 Tax=Vitis vinifera TaxID=29760 RepID=A0A438E3N4_VITVI|nr:hypothetical protein CK203_085034 [Vitis vinifera]